MPLLERYQRQVALLLRIMPIVLQEQDFALKGGTAINLFVRDMPRLSVDIDLTYLPIASRAESLASIDAAMKRIAVTVQERIAGAHVSLARLASDNIVTRLLVRTADAQIKIEVTPVLRGCVFEPEMRAVSPLVEEHFGFAEARVVSFPDLYAGKSVAALDRQHPRDLFDVRDLLATEGITPELRQAFVVYLLSHNRPMHEVLAPTLREISAEFLGEFEGMTANPVSVEDLYAARTALIEQMVRQMPDDHRRFLIGFEEGQPDWSLLGLPKAAELPAVLWRQQNLNTRSPEQRTALVKKLRKALAAD